MDLREIEYGQNMEQTLAAMAAGGLLLTTVGADGAPNAMTIGWGHAGIVWSRPVFLVYVRPSRFTFSRLAEVPEFVVNVPPEDLADACATCGSVSGRDADKFAECGLTAVPARSVRPPLIEQCVRFYECRVIHTMDVRDGELTPDVRRACYARGDLHRVYYGEILRAVERL